MKITKNQLRRIIKEEKAKLLKEQAYRHPRTGEDLLLMLNDVVDKLLDQGMDTYELAGELRGLADDVEDSRYVNAQNSAYRNQDIRGYVMKITKQQLAKIIKEEKQRLIYEMYDDDEDDLYMEAMMTLFADFSLALEKAKRAGIDHPDMMTAVDDARRDMGYQAGQDK